MYKWNAQDYQKNSEGQLKWGRELIPKLGLSGKEHVLDIGCGDGKITAEIAAQVPDGQVTGIDSSRDMIDLANNTFAQTDYANLHFIYMDAREINFFNAFDIVFSNAVLHWVDNHRKVLSAIYTALKTPGKVLLQMGGKGNAAGMMDVVLSMLKQPAWVKHFMGFTIPYYFYGPDQYTVWLKEAGLKQIRVELIPKDMRHRGKEGLEGWFRTTWHPFIARIPDEEHQLFIDQAVSLYLNEHPLDEDGFVHMNMVRLEVEAEKI